jgi:hypothetical protein
MKQTLLAIYLLFTSYISFSQGCSSAGFCTMGALKADQTFSPIKKVRLNYVELSHLVAFTGLGETIQASTIDASISISSKNKIQLRLPYAWVQGDLGKTSGFGDVYFTYTRSLFQKNNYNISVMAGTKLPRFSTNFSTKDNLPLPMYYSPSLGTYDLILGASFINKSWLLGIGFQKPIYNRSIDNQFSANAWMDSPLEQQAQKYTYSVGLQRGSDIMLRIEKNIRFNRYNFHVGLLPVYRIEADEVLEDNIRKKLKGSQGLAMTGILGAGYNFDLHSRIKLFYGHRLVARDSNADGLMKTSVTTIAYEWRF